MTDGNRLQGGDHFVVYTDVDLQCSIPKTYIVKRERRDKDLQN